MAPQTLLILVFLGYLAALCFAACILVLYKEVRNLRREILASMPNLPSYKENDVAGYRRERAIVRIGQEYTVVEARPRRKTSRTIEIMLEGVLPSGYAADIAMLGQQQVLWEQRGIFTELSGEYRSFECGNDVEYVMLRIRPTTSWALGRPITKAVDITIRTDQN